MNSNDRNVQNEQPFQNLGASGQVEFKVDAEKDEHQNKGVDCRVDHPSFGEFAS